MTKRANSNYVKLLILIVFTLMPTIASEADTRGKSDDGLLKVLVIGDSTALSYTKFLHQMLIDKAVVKCPGNAKDSGTGIKKIDIFIGIERWDIIHFNWGLWDLCYRSPKSKDIFKRDKVNGTITTSLEQYERNLRKLVARLKGAGAKLIWANTTPVPEGELGRFKGDELKYNAIAEKVMRENNITINDLHSHILPHLREFQLPNGNVHFNTDGSKYLAKKVASCILDVLQEKK